MHFKEEKASVKIALTSVYNDFHLSIEIVYRLIQCTDIKAYYTNQDPYLFITFLENALKSNHMITP